MRACLKGRVEYIEVNFMKRKSFTKKVELCM